MSDRTVYVADAVEFLKQQKILPGCSIITSMPDVSEFPQFSVEEWKNWFVDTAELILSKLSPEGVAIFYQTDIKKDGVWVDKGYLVQKAAERARCETLWHKVVCRTAPGNITFGKPAFSHMLCFSKGVKLNLKKASPDVLPQAGATTWTRGMGLEACQLACRFILENTKTQTIFNPFCGHGTVLAVANEMGLSAIGIELSANRARKARSLTVDFSLADE